MIEIKRDFMIRQLSSFVRIHARRKRLSPDSRVGDYTVEFLKTKLETIPCCDLIDVLDNLGDGHFLVWIGKYNERLGRFYDRRDRGKRLSPPMLDL